METRKFDGISLLAGTLGGAALGLCGGYVLGRVMERRDTQKRIDAEIDSLKSHYRARPRPAGRGDYARQRPAPAMGSGARLDRREGIRYDRRGATGTYASLAGEAEPAGTADVPGDADDGDNPPGPEVTGAGEPYVITIGDFADETETYQKTTITWYAADEVLVDDREIPMSDLKGTVGEDFHRHFGMGSGSDAIVYIRNERLLMDFEVVLDEGSWADRNLNYGNPNDGGD